MCIRDSVDTDVAVEFVEVLGERLPRPVDAVLERGQRHAFCLLYTSDAADERSSVDLGGRRIIKKKTNKYMEHGRVVTVQKRTPQRTTKMADQNQNDQKR